MRLHRLFIATTLVATLAPAAVRGNDNPGTASADVARQKNHHVALQASAPSNAAGKARRVPPYSSTSQTFAGIARETKTSKTASDDWSTTGGSKPRHGKPARKDPSK